MRAALVALLVALPFAGCVGPGGNALLASTLFSFHAVERGDPTPVAPPDCPGLLETLNQRALDQARVRLEQSVEQSGGYVGGGRGDVMMVEDAMATPSAASAGAPAPSVAGAEVTGTNNQEAGADEADVLKTDGEWTYVLSAGTLWILHSATIGDLEKVASVPFAHSWGGQILLERRDPERADDDRLVVILPSTTLEGNVALMGLSEAPRYGMTRIVVLSLADRANPVIVSDLSIEGRSEGARLVDGTAYVVVHRDEQGLGLRTWAWPNEEDLAARDLTWQTYRDLPEEAQKDVRRSLAREADDANQRILAGLGVGDHLPLVARSVAGLAIPLDAEGASCQHILDTPGSTGRGINTILALAVASDGLGSSMTEVVGGNSVLYASDAALVLAASSQDAWWYWAQPTLEEATDLQWFTLDGLDVQLHATGRVPGTVRDSFGLDVRGDQLRVATTTGTWGRWWVRDPQPMANHVATFTALAGKLLLQGMVGGIAPGERLWSVRFTDDRAYLVTFRNMDPLWVVDLSGPVPTILGELQIPGVSTYLHPLDDNTLLSIGLGPRDDATGTGLDWSRIQVSLFDLSDLANPRRAAVLDLAPGGEGWSWSGAIHEHKAFTYWEALGTLAIPVATYQHHRVDGVWVSENHVGVRLVQVDREGLTLSLRGEVDQDGLADTRSYGGDVQRTYFLGHPDLGIASLYAMSDRGVTSHDLATLEPQDAVAFTAST